MSLGPPAGADQLVLQVMPTCWCHACSQRAPTVPTATAPTAPTTSISTAQAPNEVC